ncbi:MAG: glycosyltransferase family 9 protein [Ignavibacteriaceae bacterium]|nr:glycosyltransferase family 9 protein [Ignavibacteriaceae bacterium]
MILTTPLLRVLKQKHPDSVIDFIVKTQYADVLKHNPRINRLFTIEKDYSYSGEKIPAPDVYDSILDLQNNLRSRRILRGFTGNIYRFRKHSMAKFLAVHFKKIEKLPSSPVPERYIHSFPGIEPDSEGCEFYFPDGYQLNNIENSKTIGLCPGSRHFSKQWPIEYYTQLAKSLITDGFKVKVIGGAGDRVAGAAVQREIPEVINVCGEDDLYKIGAEMKECAAVACNDSGLMHFATALRVPVLAIFGSTVREFGFSPYNANHIILENNSLSCRPCSHIGLDKCPEKHFKCMKDISPSEVKQKLLELIK